MSFGTLPFGVGPLSGSSGGGLAGDETAGVTPITAFAMTCDAEVAHGSTFIDRTALGFSCDAFILSGTDTAQKLLPTAWVEDAGTSSVWVPDESIAGIPSQTTPEV